MENDNASAAERHPIPPFLPSGAKALMSGSFPPPKARWCMDFFYPNSQNDMWRIFGLLADGDKGCFVNPDGKTFDKAKIEAYCRRIGLALTDTCEVAVRLKGNASDKHLQVVKPRDFTALLERMPECRTVMLTGEKAVETLGRAWGFDSIPLGSYVEVEAAGRMVRVWRMPSSSRAFPRSIEWKAEYYRRALDDAGCDYKI